ncbi:hypothetical protein C8N47_12647 [Mangrovibacterium marinum]|uniref:Uncharacterized protein n=2 Tax=Mangrovibacterium marinum TaxID=1639118 RepID=A0A2T5BXS0_9BACT|nr:hypothetical protein C8N47_12647 [Mangrovibacterium marinum]
MLLMVGFHRANRRCSAPTIFVVRMPQYKQVQRTDNIYSLNTTKLPRLKQRALEATSFMIEANTKTLYLTIKKEYFDQIERGEKESEFREFKRHWIQKLMNANGTFKHYDLILFRNGYHKNAPQITVEFKGIRIIKQKRGWFRHQKYFEIKLGKITSRST